MEKALTYVAIGIIGLGGVVIFAALYAVPVWLIWNAVVPYVFVGVPEITFLQALGLSVLCSLLFKSHNSSKD